VTSSELQVNEGLDLFFLMKKGFVDLFSRKCNGTVYSFYPAVFSRIKGRATNIPGKINRLFRKREKFWP